DLSEGDLLLRFVRIEALLQRVHGAGVATLAVATGRTWGAGADLFAACDRRLAFADASFAFPGSGFGLVLGTARLAGRIGDAAARRLLLDGSVIDA
ncbi:enoyl-CoA hydratase-related protein, partial [Acinetobacter baumannii]